MRQIKTLPKLVQLVSICLFSLSINLSAQTYHFIAQQTNKIHKPYLQNEYRSVFSTVKKKDFNFEFDKEIKLTSTATSGLLLLNPIFKSSLNTTELIPIRNKTYIAGAMLVPTFVTGFMLANTEKPYNTLLLTTHKLSAASNVVLLDIAAIQKNRLTGLSTGEKVATIFMNACYLTAIATGGIMSMEGDKPQYIKTIHRTAPWISMLSSATVIFLFNK